MLTRDIDLKDAILDLLDNCVDGIQRTLRDEAENEASPDLPYEGFWADIELSESGFTISDNCGGIPLDVAQRYAFRMGKPKGVRDDDNIATIDTYGIGLKRAIFKMGQTAQVLSLTAERICTTCTSKWRQMPAEEKHRIQQAKAQSPSLMFERVKKVDDGQFSAAKGKKSDGQSSKSSVWTAVKDKKLSVEQRFIPNLPTPPPIAQRKRISFNKPVDEVRTIAEYLFEDPDCPATAVGEACFEEVLGQAQDS